MVISYSITELSTEDAFYLASECAVFRDDSSKTTQLIEYASYHCLPKTKEISDHVGMLDQFLYCILGIAHELNIYDEIKCIFILSGFQHICIDCDEFLLAK